MDSFFQRLTLHGNRVAEFNRRVFIRSGAPDFSVRHKATPNFSPVHQWAVVFDRDIRQRDALLNLGSLANIRQIQIVLSGSDLAKAGNGETNDKRLKRDCFHIVAVTLLRFSVLRYQIITRFSTLWGEG